MDTRIERIVLETDRLKIIGELHLPREGYRSRLSDYLNHGEVVFIPLANATVKPINGDDGEHVRDFIAVARVHVHLAYPANDNGDAVA
jgi:hypothetical protein